MNAANPAKKAIGTETVGTRTPNHGIGANATAAAQGNPVTTAEPRTAAEPRRESQPTQTSNRPTSEDSALLEKADHGQAKWKAYGSPYQKVK